MNKSHLLTVCIIFASLAGFTQSASATTLFGLNFDFGSQGDGWLQFEVDPNNLPFDQWIDLTTVTGLQAQFTIVDSARSFLSVFVTEVTMNQLSGSVFITNANPLFPVVLSEDLMLLFQSDYVCDGAVYVAFRYQSRRRSWTCYYSNPKGTAS